MHPNIRNQACLLISKKTLTSPLWVEVLIIMDVCLNRRKNRAIFSIASWEFYSRFYSIAECLVVIHRRFRMQSRLLKRIRMKMGDGVTG